MKIGVLGPKGTFSDKAYLKFKKYVNKQLEKRGETIDLEVEYFPTIDEVFFSNSIDLGLVPIENTLDGYVQRTLDLLLEENAHIIDETFVPVQFSLVGNVSSLDEIEKLFVQFKANGQCRNFINTLKGVEIVSTESNMDSYYKIGDTKGYAAIVPQHIAEEETERFVVENVTDMDSNYTRFVLFDKGDVGIDNLKQEFGKPHNMDGHIVEKRTSDKVRIPVYIMPKEDKPGLLFHILKCFYEKDINLISIMSRPTKQAMGTYNFYIEIDTYCDRLDVIIDALSQIGGENGIKILGVYEE